MPDKRHHRGPHPDDPRLFDSARHAGLNAAVRDLSWLLSHGYATPSSVKLVGDRYNLEERQRTAVMRASCPDDALASRLSRKAQLPAVRDRPIVLDGYNILTTIEAALGGAVILDCRDSALRDMASMHGSFRKVAETPLAATLVGRTLAELGASAVHWLLDAPVSNSGRLKTLLLDLAKSQSWPWTLDLVPDPDKICIDSPTLIASADSVILDHCPAWLNLARHIVITHVPTTPRLVPMTGRC